MIPISRKVARAAELVRLVAEHDVVEVVVFSPGVSLDEAQARMKVFGHLREWCADNPGVKVDLLT